MKYIFTIALLAFFLTGCAGSAPQSSSPPESLPTVAATATPSPAPSPSEHPTPSPQPTQDPLPENNIELKDGITYVNGILIANKTYSLPKDYAPGVDPQAKAAFEEMKQAAAAEGLNIYISSSFRSYEYQTKIYNNYVTRDGQEAADTYSARPGHSEHQTGLAFDLNTIDDSFAATPEAKWVAAHAHKYGFVVRYPADKTEITGFKYEPWHIRYLGKETAQKVFESGLCLEEYLNITSIYA